MTKMASLVLEDGTTFTGLLFGADVSVSGEVGKPRTQSLDWVAPVPNSPGLSARGVIVLLLLLFIFLLSVLFVTL